MYERMARCISSPPSMLFQVVPMQFEVFQQAAVSLLSSGKSYTGVTVVVCDLDVLTIPGQ